MTDKKHNGVQTRRSESSSFRHSTHRPAWQRYAGSTTLPPEPHTTGRKGLSLQNATLLMGLMVQSRPEITKKRYLNSRG